MHDELTEAKTRMRWRDMIYAGTAAEIATRRKVFLRKWRLRCSASPIAWRKPEIACSPSHSLESSQWKSARATNAIERLNEEFRHRLETQTVLPCAETVQMLLWALLALGQIQMRRVDGWETFSQPIARITLDQAA